MEQKRGRSTSTSPKLEPDAVISKGDFFNQITVNRWDRFALVFFILNTLHQLEDSDRCCCYLLLTDKLLFKVVNLSGNKFILDEDKAPTRADFVERYEIDCSTLYSFDGPFQLVHADVGNLEFLGKNVIFPQYALAIVDLYSSKVYTYSMKSRK